MLCNSFDEMVPPMSCLTEYNIEHTNINLDIVQAKHREAPRQETSNMFPGRKKEKLSSTSLKHYKNALIIRS